MYIKLKILNIPKNSSMIGYFKKNFKIFTYPDISLKNNIAIITEKIAERRAKENMNVEKEEKRKAENRTDECNIN